MAYIRKGKLKGGKKPRLIVKTLDMTLELVDVYEGGEDTFERNVKFLYRMLAQRDETINISHKRMPLFKNHCKFIKTRPYKYWYLIIVDDVMAGSIYISKQNEIGLFIHAALKGQGIGKTALQKLLSVHIERPLYANINPANTNSINFFTRYGFSYYNNLINNRGNVIQNTYIIT